MSILETFFVFSLLAEIYVVFSLSDVTGRVFSKRATGLIAAFGDFNADKHTDIFVISSEGKSLSVYLASIEKEFQEIQLLDNKTVDTELYITSVVPADFNGDLLMDVLVTLSKKGTDDFTVFTRIFWGHGNGVDTKPENILKLPNMTDQPLLMDKNADMIPDLFGEKSPGDRYFWIFNQNGNFTEVHQELPSGQDKFAPLRTPQSSSFVDLNNDLTTDLCVVSKNVSATQLEYWINENGNLSLKETVVLTYEKELKVVGQFSFADFDGDLLPDPLVPACLDDDCAQSLLLVYKNKKWVSLPVNFQYAQLTWNFIPQTQSGAPGFIKLPVSVRLGDFNLDGYPDLLAVLGNATGNLHRAVIMYNKPCDSCVGFSRTFTIDWDTWLEAHDSRALLPAFYDVYDNGILDIIVTSIDSNGVPSTEVKLHEFVDDACFMKVMVVSGLCNYDCPFGRKPYGVNQPGPVVRYKTTDVKGGVQQKIAFQLSQSAYLPLQLPYSVFGLGQTPNFVDVLEVGIPTNSSHKLYRDWQSLIPNSQLVIIPYPVNDPSGWTNKLFVTPSRLMMLTGAALLGTCGFIAGIVGILHWRDKIEDKKEKRQESQKFHFDAM